MTTMLTLIGEHPDDPLRGALAVFEARCKSSTSDPICSRIDANCSSVIPTLLQQHLATFHDLEDTLTRILTRELSNRTEYRRLHSDTAAADEATATVITAGAAMRYVFRKWQNSERASPRTDLLDPAPLLMARILRSES